jgi:hypothetical protein
MFQRWMWVLWPSFIAAALGEAMFFTFFDPEDLALFGEPLKLSRLAVYSVSFFLFWMLGSLSSALTCFLQRSSAELNRCPLRPTERPHGCPKRADVESAQ